MLKNNIYQIKANCRTQKEKTKINSKKKLVKSKAQVNRKILEDGASTPRNRLISKNEISALRNRA